MFGASVPVALQALDQALVLLDKATPAMLTARLAPGLFTCAEQFQTVAGFALRATYPLAGKDVPELDYPADMEGLRAALSAAQSLVGALTVADFDGSAERQITHQAGFADLTQSAPDYLQHFALPNLWFHLSMAYAILRQQGAPVGKADFDGLHAYPADFAFDD